MLHHKKEPDLNLGDNHYLTFIEFKPNRELISELNKLPDNDKIGGIIKHKKLDGTWCEGTIWFDCLQVNTLWSNKSKWTVKKWEPLTCSPSFLCHCGDHGFIKEGRWIKA